MLLKLQAHLQQHFPFLEQKKLLLAVSGGIDSMVLVHLLRRLGYDVVIAHCNFGLRSEESNGDEKFVAEYAADYNIKLFVTKFDTERFAADNKLSIQVAARQLRYIWFYQLLEENDLDYILTAHHLDDNIETFLINFTRGTGLEGLTGIPQQNGKIIRPLLGFSRTEIEAYAAENSIIWREDSSNASDKYLRNKIRHEVLPVLRTLNSSCSDSFKQTLEHLQQAQSMVADAAVLVYKQVVTEQENRKIINVTELKRLPNYQAYLYQWLSSFGFTAWDDIYSLAEAQPGKQVLAAGYRLLKDRDILILEPLRAQDTNVYTIDEGQETVEEPLKLRLRIVNDIDKNATKNTIFVHNQLIKFPLLVRKWEKGDYFYPLGMKGLKKKISKYFKDEKMSLSDKESSWLLCSGNDIIWVIGKRADERFKVSNTTTQILKIEVL